MSTLSNPSEIARETLRQLATRRIPPTPDNYRTLYLQISGAAESASEAFPERQAKALIAALPTDSPGGERLVKHLERSLHQKNWGALVKAIGDFVGSHGMASDWAGFLPTLLREWETRHAGITPGRKRELLEHALASCEDSSILLARLKNVVKAWSQAPVAGTVEGDPAPAGQKTEDAGTPTAPPLPDATKGMLPELKELFAFTLENVVAAHLAETPELASEANAMAVRVRSAAGTGALAAILPDLKRLAFRLELLAEDRTEIRGGLVHLLQLMIENVSDLVIDDTWLHGQIALVRDIVGKPLSLRAIDDAERRLKEVIFKQSQLRVSLNEAKQALKTMLAGFVDHLASFADSASDYHDKIEVCAKKISEANDIGALGEVIREVMHETRIIQLNAQRSRDELRAVKKEAEVAEQRIQQLQTELDQASQLVRHDQLTGALNRRGLEEVFDKEMARARRRRSPLCLAVLDIDDFKRLNDGLGHQAGDAALVHLTQVIRETMRPQDTTARFGGEEFILLLPDTELDEARQAIVRLQRELTRKFFLHDNQKVLITFSAGVTQLPPEETRDEAIKRADELMYQAKQTGKNKVIAQ